MSEKKKGRFANGKMLLMTVQHIQVDFFCTPNPMVSQEVLMKSVKFSGFYPFLSIFARCPGAQMHHCHVVAPGRAQLSKGHLWPRSPSEATMEFVFFSGIGAYHLVLAKSSIHPHVYIYIIYIYICICICITCIYHLPSPTV